MVKAPYSPSEQEKLDAVHHIVHEYANLVSSGRMMLTGRHLGSAIQPPINTHVQHAFLLNCRKMADFFGGRIKQKDVSATHYVEEKAFKLAKWDSWKKAIDKQLAHITYTRLNEAKEWTCADNAPLLAELKKVWKEFLQNLEGPYKGEFERQITERLDSEFAGLDLR